MPSSVKTLGILGGGNNLLIQDCEVDHNNASGYAGYDLGNEVGAMKIIGSDGAVIRHNNVHDNAGPVSAATSATRIC